jgi:transposase
MSRQIYPSDLTDGEWPVLQPLVSAPKLGGRPSKYPRREIINAIRYVARTGCAWRLLAHDLPPWQLAYHYFWVWRRDGTWQQIHDSLHLRIRQAQGREPIPSAAIIEVLRLKDEDHGKEGPRGYDAGKKVKGRKRHIVVDTQGLLLDVAVHPADI